MGKAHSPMRLSVIVPAYNNPQALRECLAALIASADSAAEILVADDASTDDTPAVAAQMGVRVLRLAENSGPAAARNHGARQPRGEILFFVDETGNPEASTFWAGCGAIRRSVFEGMCGFDEKRFPRPSIEDIEPGYRLRHAGHRTLLDKALQGTHLKHWTLCSAIRTDILCRAVPWSRLILESKKAPDDLNLKSGQRLSVALVGLGGMCLPFAMFRIELLVLWPVTLLGVILLNRGLFAFFLRR